MRNQLLIIGTALLVFYAAVGKANNQPHFTLIFASNMPDITDFNSNFYAPLDTLVSDLKQQDNVFFIYGGGSIGPSAMATFDQGSHIIDILNSIEPDVMGITKREFSYFADELSLRAYEAAFPIVASNIKDIRTEQPIDGINATTLIHQNDFTLGFISIIHPRVINEYLLKNVTVLDPLLTIKKQATLLKEQGADVILLHYSYPYEFIKMLLDENIIDVAFLSEPGFGRQFFKKITQHPKSLALRKQGTAIISQFQRVAGVVSLVEANEVDLSLIAPSPPIKKQIEAYQTRLNRLLNIKIGTWLNDFSTNWKLVRSGENPFANLVTDTMLKYTGADIAIINGGSIRGNMNYKANAPITRRTIVTELPFLSKVSTLKITGEAIINALEIGYAQQDIFKGGYLHVSGIKVIIDSSRPIGRRVMKVTIDGEPLKKDKYFSLATTDFLANGGDGYSILMHLEKDTNSRFDAPLISDLVTQAIIEQRSVKLTRDKRVEDTATPKL